MNSYFLCVTQQFNAGDLLINRMLIEELSHYGTVYVDCYNCSESFKSILIGNSPCIIDVYSTYRFSLKKGSFFSFARFLKEKNVALYTQSPGPLNKVHNILVKTSFKIIRNVLSIMHIPFIRIGSCCSAAMLSNINVLENSNVQYYVRSNKSVEFLKQFRNYGIHYIPDLAYLYRDHVEISEKLKIAVMSFRKVTESLNEFISWVRNCIDLLNENGYKVIFYYQVEPDYEFMKYLYDSIGNEFISLRSDLVWYDNFDFYSDKSIVISNRLHCLLLGALYDAVPLAYVDNNRYVRKIQDVFESSFGADAPKYITDNTSLEKLYDIVKNLSEHQKVINDKVFNNASLCRSKIKSIITLLSKNKSC